MADRHGLGGRLPLLLPRDLTPRAKALYDRLLASPLGSPDAAFTTATDDGELIGPYNACLRQPEIAAAFLGL